MALNFPSATADGLGLGARHLTKVNTVVDGKLVPMGSVPIVERAVTIKARLDKAMESTGQGIRTVPAKGKASTVRKIPVPKVTAKVTPVPVDIISVPFIAESVTLESPVTPVIAESVTQPISSADRQKAYRQRKSVAKSIADLPIMDKLSPDARYKLANTEAIKAKDRERKAAKKAAIMK